MSCLAVAHKHNTGRTGLQPTERYSFMVKTVVGCAMKVPLHLLHHCAVFGCEQVSQFLGTNHEIKFGMRASRTFNICMLSCFKLSLSTYSCWADYTSRYSAQAYINCMKNSIRRRVCICVCTRCLQPHLTRHHYLCVVQELCVLCEIVVICCLCAV